MTHFFSRARLFKFARLAVFTIIACAIVLLIPAAPGQVGGGGAPNPSVSNLPTANSLPWRPFLDPMHIHGQWYWLLLPLAFGISLVYKAVRLHTLDRYWLQVLNMTVQIAVAMVLLGAATYLLVTRFAPFVAMH